MGHAARHLDRVRDPEVGRHPADELAAGSELREVGPVRKILREKRAKPRGAPRRIGGVEERVGRRVVRVERVAPDRQERLIDVDVVVVEVRLIVEDAAAARGRSSAGSRVGSQTSPRRGATLFRSRLMWLSGAGPPNDLTNRVVVAVDELVAGQDAVVDVVAEPEVQRQVVAHLPRVLREQRRRSSGPRCPSPCRSPATASSGSSPDR